jgi:hypothetical protein
VKQIDNGWISRDLSTVSWSFYLLIISLLINTVNIVLILQSFRLKKSITELNEINLITNNNNNDNNEILHNDSIDIIDNSKISTRMRKVVDFIY